MLHATLFLFKSTTFDGTHPAVSISKHYLKGKHYGYQYTEHRFCVSIRQHSALVEGRIGVSGVFIRRNTGGIWHQIRALQGVAASTNNGHKGACLLTSAIYRHHFPRSAAYGVHLANGALLQA